MTACCKKSKKKQKILYNLYYIGWRILVVCSHGTEDDDDAGEVSPHQTQGIFSDEAVLLPILLHDRPSPQQGNHLM